MHVWLMYVCMVQERVMHACMMHVLMMRVFPRKYFGDPPLPPPLKFDNTSLKKNTFSFGHCPKRGGLPKPKLFGPFIHLFIYHLFKNHKISFLVILFINIIKITIISIIIIISTTWYFIPPYAQNVIVDVRALRPRDPRR